MSVGSGSVASSVITGSVVMSSFVDTAWSLATGGSLTSLTVIETVAAEVLSKDSSSLALKVKVSVLTKLLFGRYVRAPDKTFPVV